MEKLWFYAKSNAFDYDRTVKTIATFYHLGFWYSEGNSKKKYYSGKKKRHTVKVQITADEKSKDIMSISEVLFL